MSLPSRTPPSAGAFNPVPSGLLPAGPPLHWCFVAGCGAWGAFGFRDARGGRVWFCGAHREVGEGQHMAPAGPTGRTRQAPATGAQPKTQGALF